MTAQQIVERIKQKDWTLVERPGTVGGEAVAAVLPLLEHDDAEVRELALKALSDPGGAEARAAAIKALRDPDDMVRAAAGELLQKHHHEEDLPKLYEELRKNQDQGVREDVALAIGRIGQEASVDALKKQLDREPDDRARHAISLALARIREKEHHRRYVERLHHEQPRERAMALQDFPYVNDRGLLQDVSELLDDTRDALNAGPSRKKMLIRVCDVAVNMLDPYLDHPFGFEIYRRKRYPAKELAAAKAVVLGVK